MASWATSGKPSVFEESAQIAAPAHSGAMSSTAPGSSIRSASPTLAACATSSGRSGPSPRMRSRQSRSSSATCSKARTRWMNCFSGTIRPAVTIVLDVRSERGWAATGNGLGITTSAGAVDPSSAPSQSAVERVSSATAATRGAKASRGSMPPTRSADERCSWWSTFVPAGTSWTAAAIRAGVTVMTRSTSRSDRAAIASSVSSENWLSQRLGTNLDGRLERGSGVRTSARWSTPTPGSIG